MTYNFLNNQVDKYKLENILARLRAESLQANRSFSFVIFVPEHSDNERVERDRKYYNAEIVFYGQPNLKSVKPLLRQVLTLRKNDAAMRETHDTAAYNYIPSLTEQSDFGKWKRALLDHIAAQYRAGITAFVISDKNIMGRFHGVAEIIDAVQTNVSEDIQIAVQVTSPSASNTEVTEYLAVHASHIFVDPKVFTLLSNENKKNPQVIVNIGTMESITPNLQDLLLAANASISSQEIRRINFLIFESSIGNAGWGALRNFKNTHSQLERFMVNFADFAMTEEAKGSKNSPVLIDPEDKVQNQVVGVRVEEQIYPEKTIIVGNDQAETTILNRPKIATGADTRQDRGSATRPAHTGGIDFTKVDVQIKRDGNGVPLPIPMQDLGQIEKRLKGFTPVIINVAPLPNLIPLLGLSDEKEFETLSRLNY